MRKVFILGGLFLTLASCQVAEPRASLPAPLPDNVTPVPYSQLLTRARTQATRATEALFVDNFADVEEAARGLEQTAKLRRQPLFNVDRVMSGPGTDVDSQHVYFASTSN